MMLQKYCFITIFFVYLYEVNFVFIPYVTSKQVMELLGFLLFVSNANPSIKIKDYRSIFFWSFFLVIIAFFSIIFNGGGQWMYHTVVVSTVLNFFGAYFLCRISRNIVTDFESLLKTIIICVTAQCLIAVMFKAVPATYNFVYRFVSNDLICDSFDYGIEDFYRLAGLGNAVAFSSLPTSFLGLLSCAYLITKKKGVEFYKYCGLYLFIVCVSFLLARTSLLLSALSFLYILIVYYKYGRIKEALRIISIAIAAIALIAVYAILILPPDMYLWAFEVFINIMNGGTGTESGTGEVYYSMLTETMFTPLSLIVGDAMYSNKEGGYYGGADIGYFRQVLYYGFIGLFFFLKAHRVIIKKCVKMAPEYESKLFFKFLFIALLTILIKGDIVLTSYFILMLVFVDQIDNNAKSSMGYCDKMR